MRSRRHTQAEDETAIDLTPMLDIVFIMLIFFIVTTSFVKEAGVTINRPEASSGEPQEGNNIVVAITASGAIYVDGNEYDIRALRPQIERLRAANPEGAVVIQADERSDVGRLIPVMDQVKAAGVDKIAVATEKK